MTDVRELAEIMDRFAGKRVLVVGDLMVDEHIWGDVGRVSPEAPVIVVEAQESESRPGGAANVVNNVHSLGARASVVGLVGNDDHGRRLVELLTLAGVNVDGVVIDASRPTTRKTRIWASHRQQVVRVDWESRRPIMDVLVDEIIRHLRREMEYCDAIVLSDYSKGVLTPEVISSAVESARACDRICASNAKPEHLRHFGGMSALTLNLAEAETALGRRLPDDAALCDGGCALLGELAVESLIITLGSRGLTLFEGGPKITHVPAMPIEVYDVAGAGDTVISTLALALASGAAPVDAARLANAAGGAVVRKVGVATTAPDEIAQLLIGTGTTESSVIRIP